MSREQSRLRFLESVGKDRVDETLPLGSNNAQIVIDKEKKITFSENGVEPKFFDNLVAFSLWYYRDN